MVLSVRSGQALDGHPQLQKMFSDRASRNASYFETRKCDGATDESVYSTPLNNS